MISMLGGMVVVASCVSCRGDILGFGVSGVGVWVLGAGWPISGCVCAGGTCGGRSMISGVVMSSPPFMVCCDSSS